MLMPVIVRGFQKAERYFWGLPAIISFTFTVSSPTVIMVTFFPSLRGSWTISSSTIRTPHTLNITRVLLRQELLHLQHTGLYSSREIRCQFAGSYFLCHRSIGVGKVGEWTPCDTEKKREISFAGLRCFVDKHIAVVSRRLFARNRHE